MPQAFTGYNPLEIEAARFDAILLGNDNAGFSVEKIPSTMRKLGSIDIELQTVADQAARDIPLGAYIVKTKIESLQSSISDLFNFYLLHKAPHQAYFKDAAAKYWAFVKNTGTAASPVGTGLLYSAIEFQLTDTDRYINLDSQCQLSSAEMDEMDSLSGSAPSGGTGTGTWGFNSEPYEANPVIVGYHDITVGGVSIGEFSNTKINMKSVKQADSHRQGPINRKIHVDAEFTLQQTGGTNWEAVRETLERTDASVIFYTKAGETFNFNAGALRWKTKYTLDDKQRMIVCTGSGDFTNNADESAPGSMDIGKATPTEVKFFLTGYATS